jgi:hypothetical protein
MLYDAGTLELNCSDRSNDCSLRIPQFSRGKMHHSVVLLSCTSCFEVHAADRWFSLRCPPRRFPDNAARKSGTGPGLSCASMERQHPLPQPVPHEIVNRRVQSPRCSDGEVVLHQLVELFPLFISPAHQSIVSGSFCKGNNYNV